MKWLGALALLAMACGSSPSGGRDPDPEITGKWVRLENHTTSHVLEVGLVPVGAETSSSRIPFAISPKQSRKLFASDLGLSCFCVGAAAGVSLEVVWDTGDTTQILIAQEDEYTTIVLAAPG